MLPPFTPPGNTHPKTAKHQPRWVVVKTGFHPVRGWIRTPGKVTTRPRRINDHGNHSSHDNAKVQRVVKPRFHSSLKRPRERTGRGALGRYRSGTWPAS